MGSLKNIIKLALKNPAWTAGEALIPEAVLAKMT